MKGHCSIEELSAYIDGETADPERTAEHLRNCAACAGLHEQLLSVSGHVSALPGIQLGPEFLTRVMAHAAARAEQPPRWRWAGVRLAIAGCLAALVLVAAALYVARGLSSAPAPAKMALEKTGPALIAEGPSELHVAEPEEVSEDFESLGNADDASVDEMITGLSQTEWFGALAAAWEADVDLDVLLGSMDEDEAADFRNLLRDYIEEGQVT